MLSIELLRGAVRRRGEKWNAFFAVNLQERKEKKTELLLTGRLWLLGFVFYDEVILLLISE